ncbi:DNA alkylation repair protein [Marisediminicola senii]|uniref:DNA alkylation repair protein n=1 Tax=Marisediminicola senii TaxID=2711233 RepID=UPI0013EDEBD7|nr:DNA alkylation repair protein [Marisediminicola senii]
MPGAGLTAASVRAALVAAARETERAKIATRMTDDVTTVIGVRMATVFDIAKAHTAMTLDEVDRLLDSDAYEERMVAVSVLDFKARQRRTTPSERQALYNLWMRRLDRLDTWDYLDRSAPRVVGAFLLERPRDVLFDLARSPNRWHRRASIVAAFWIIREGDIDDPHTLDHPLALCAMLAADAERFVQTAVGTALREIGRRDAARLETFLAQHGDTLIAEARRTARSALSS